MTSADLWRQLLAAPNDAQLRTRYTGALLQEGDRRAEPFLVGAEIESRNRNRKSHTTQDLQKHCDELTKPMAAELADCLQRWNAKLKFVFGWPSEITIKARDFIQHANEIVSTIPLRHLNLLSVNEATDVFQVPQFNQIQSLYAGGQVWSNKAVQALTGSPHLSALRWLNLSKTGLGEKQVDMLAAAQNLRKLDQIDLTKNNSRDPVDAAAGAGYDGNTGYIVVESIYVPEFGRELESKYGKIRWLNTLYNFCTFPIDRYT